MTEKIKIKVTDEDGNVLYNEVFRDDSTYDTVGELNELLGIIAIENIVDADNKPHPAFLTFSPYGEESEYDDLFMKIEFGYIE